MNEAIRRLMGLSAGQSPYRNVQQHDQQQQQHSPNGRKYRIMCQVDGEQPCSMFSNINIDKEFQIVIKPPVPGTDNVYLTIINKFTNRTVRIYGEIEE